MDEIFMLNIEKQMSLIKFNKKDNEMLRTLVLKQTYIFFPVLKSDWRT